MSEQYLTRQQVLNRIRAEIDKAGGVAKLAVKLNVTPSYVSNVMGGSVPGPKFCKLLGIKREKQLWSVVKK